MDEEVAVEPMNVERMENIPNHAIFGWGSASQGQLGLGPSGEDTVLQPILIPSLQVCN